MSRLLYPIEENTATLHFCLGSGSPQGRERTAFSTRRISRTIPTCIICNAQLPFTTYYCSTTEVWWCQDLWWLGRCRPEKFFLFEGSKIISHHLSAWLNDSLVCGGRVEKGGCITSVWITWIFVSHVLCHRMIWCVLSTISKSTVMYSDLIWSNALIVYCTVKANTGQSSKESKEL